MACRVVAPNIRSARLAGQSLLRFTGRSAWRMWPIGHIRTALIRQAATGDRFGVAVTEPVIHGEDPLGLALPAVVWPFSQFLRRRWESRSWAALAPLWEDISSATTEVVLASSEFHEEKHADDSDFFLYRRVIEINDGGLALRPHRSLRVQESAERAVAANAAWQAPRKETRSWRPRSCKPPYT